MLIRPSFRLAGCGLVGYPNVGKSTVFNALVGSTLAEAANYPFCTIDPNISKVTVKDQTLDKIAKIQNSKRIIYDQIEIRDIAGLIKGASKGEGMGNAFLSHIRSGINVILHVVRCFEDNRVASVLLNRTSPEPIREFNDIQEELIIADIDFVTKRMASRARVTPEVYHLMESVLSSLDTGNRARATVQKVLKETPSLVNSAEAQGFIGQLITGKPVIVVANADSGDQCSGIQAHVERLDESMGFVWLNASREAEATAMISQGEAEFAAEWLPEPRIDLLTEKCRQSMAMNVFYTLGVAEARSWLVRSGAKAPEAGGVIHSDFDKYFTKCEVTKVDDLIKHGLNASKAHKGREYVIPDSQDIIDFKIRR